MSVNKSPPIAVTVKCYAGYRGEQTPTSFVIWGKEHKVTELVDQWLAPAHRYFKVKDETGDIFILRHDQTSFAWELTMYLTAQPASVKPTDSAQAGQSAYSHCGNLKITRGDRTKPEIQ